MKLNKDSTFEGFYQDGFVVLDLGFGFGVKEEGFLVSVVTELWNDLTFAMGRRNEDLVFVCL